VEEIFTSSSMITRVRHPSAPCDVNFPPSDNLKSVSPPSKNTVYATLLLRLTAFGWGNLAKAILKPTSGARGSLLRAKLRC
jgi:hypothetical protein